MVRLALLIAVALLPACADQSKGSTLNGCRVRYYLDDPAAQAELIPACMKAQSFEAVPKCSPAQDEYQWDWQVRSFSFDNPQCYRPVGPLPWVATVLSPM